VSPFADDHYVLKRQILRLWGEGFGIYDPQGTKVLQADEPPFRWRKEIRLTTPYGLNGSLGIFAQSFASFAARYDVVDLQAGTKIGGLQRKWLHSMMRDEWSVLDVWDREVGQVIEDSMGLALVRRFALGLIPQNYDLVVGGRKVVDLRQSFNPFTYHLQIDFLVPPAHFDRRLGFAAAVLLGAVEGRQGSERGAVESLVDVSPF